VLGAGPSHAWDSDYVNPVVVLKVSGVYSIYTMGRKVAGDSYIGIGLATSTDGLTFTRNYGPSVTGQSPASGGTGTATQDIYFEVDDPTFLIDIDLLDVDVDINAGGFATVIVNGVCQAGYSCTIPSDGGTGYDVTVDPDADFSSGDTVTVRVTTAQNVIGDVLSNYTYVYTVTSLAGSSWFIQQQSKFLP